MDKIGTVDPLSLLERKDKWFLGGGTGSIYAPPFPRWLEKPGFWDECFYADIRLTRIFTVLFCDELGLPLKLSGQVLSWRPDRLIIEHRGSGRVIRETRLVTERHEWTSVFELLEGESGSAFVWGMPELRATFHGAPCQTLSSIAPLSNSMSYRIATSWPAEIEPDRTGVEEERLRTEATRMLDPLEVVFQLGANRPRLSYTVNLAQRHDDSPIWQTSMLPQKLREGRLPGDLKLCAGPPPIEGYVHILQQYPLDASEPLVVTCSASLTRNSRQEEALPGPEVIAKNESDWMAYFASVPQFSSSDPHLTAAYWYRWYGLRLNTIDIPELPICQTDPVKFEPPRTNSNKSEPPRTNPNKSEQIRTNPNQSEPTRTYSPFITEGIGFFRNFVTYSSQAHLREVAWMHSPRLGRGILENLAKCQRSDGSFPGHNYSCRPPRDFYHADFATGAELLGELHPGSTPATFLSAFVRYGSYFLDHRQMPADPNVYTVFDQNETGQEYMSRYQFASEDADKWGTFVVGGVDATTYAVLMFDFLARKVGGRATGKVDLDWEGEAGQTVGDVLDELYDNENGFFCDLSRGKLSPARPATGFYPFLLAKQADWKARSPHYDLHRVLDRWLLNPNEFWLPRGFPATALSDPTFSASSEWKGKRLNCPWNGRSWPMVNSHLVDAIAKVARTLKDDALRAKAGEALMKAVTLMFHEGDPARPNSYEHYDPFTGTPSLYRGYDDYMHSWIVDLILRHAVGVQPGEDEVDPLPLGVEWIECTDIPHPKGRMSVRIELDNVKSLTIDNNPRPTPDPLTPKA